MTFKNFCDGVIAVAFALIALVLMSALDPPPF